MILENIMSGSNHKKWVESVIEEENSGEIAHPLDGWIALALYSDERHVRQLYEIVGSALKRLKWEIENVPYRWIHVRERKINQLSQWVALQDKLMSLFQSLDDIPF